MKKLFLFLSLSFILSTGYSQIMFDAVTATVSITSDIGVPIKTKGAIIIQVSSAFNGTNDTLKLFGGVLKGSTIIWTPCYQNDGVTLAQFTLTSAANATPVSFDIQGADYAYYRLIYYKGNTSAGTLTAVAFFKGQ